MMERFVYWFSSLRSRLIITYMLVMIASYALLLLLVLPPMERTMLTHERDTLDYLADTIGSTIRTPWENKENFASDQAETQRRTYNISTEIDARIRVLDALGNVLTDTTWGHPRTKDWPMLVERRKTLPSLIDRQEIWRARMGRFDSSKRFASAVRRDDERPGGGQILYVARPVLRKNPHFGNRSTVAFIIYISRPLDSVYNDLSTLRHFFLYGILVSLSITILITILLSGQLSAGLQSAMRVARSFAAGGNMDLRMREQGRDEVGQLGRAFNHMADALQRQEQLRRDLLADVSHELRTPLTAISGCADTLADGDAIEDPKVAARFLSIIQRESDRLQRLVSDILELSKLQAGAIRIPLKPLDIVPVIEDAVEIAAMHARNDDITIQASHQETKTPLGPIFVLGNEDRLAQALRNLLDNARHHSPPGTIVTVNLAEYQDTVAVRITDEGEGIPPDDLPWVFDRFYRAGKGEKKPGGTGLGLPIVREIMLAHHGDVRVESTVGKGTTFSLHLKRVQAEGTS